MRGPGSSSADAVALDGFAPSADRMPGLLARFEADRATLERRWPTPHSPVRRDRLKAFLAAWQEAVEALPFDDLGPSDRADWFLFRNLLEGDQRRLDREAARWDEMAPLLPFAAGLLGLLDDRMRLRDVDAPAAAGVLDRATAAMRETRAALERGEAPGPVRPTVAHRAAQATDAICKALEEDWFAFYAGYDPAFTWWIERPWRALQDEARATAGFLRAKVAGAEDAEAIVGDPVGREALLDELALALIPCTPEELIGLAEREMAWCQEELRRAARDMGCGDDWRAAMERVKDQHAAPGGQPALVRDLAEEAIGWVRERDLVTVPPLAAECWRMAMLSPESQKVSPFFLGGECIHVSFPTGGMEHAQKRMSLRGNNPAFSRATVQHELIPGHYLQQFSQERCRPYRRLFHTPFWTEGWTLHWEMLLWERGFPRTPEERIGMLFWRAHRCARVVFSLGFHLGQMTAQECVEMLVNDVGHERANALAEVRRSFGGDYEALYQLAYLIGGLQVHALHREMVGAGGMTDRGFHDAVLRENCMPIAVLRALLRGELLERAGPAAWRFA